MSNERTGSSAPSQAERFRAAAKAAEADESDDALDRAFVKLDPKARPGDDGGGKDVPKGD